MKTIYFVNIYKEKYNYASGYLRGQYIVENISIDNYNLEYINFSKIYKNIKKGFIYKNCIFIIIKGIVQHVPIYVDILSSLKKNNNILVHDILDMYCLIKDWHKDKKYVEFENLFDFVIVNSHHMNDYLENFLKPKIEVIYNSFDPRIIPTKIIKNEVNYYGCMEKLNIKNTNNLKINLKLNYNLDSSVHFTFLDPEHSYFNDHTTTKLATAISSGSVFVSNKIPVFYELLKDYYIYFCANNEESLEKYIEKAKLLIKDKVNYDKYIESLDEIKNILSPEKMLDNYKIFLKKIIIYNY